MDVLKLIGVVVVVIGFSLKFDVIATIVLAGIATGLVAVSEGSMSLLGIFETLGKSFVSQRLATLLVLTLGVIGTCERNGLKNKAIDLIKKLRGATAGTIFSVWELVRTLAAAFSLRIGGHVQFIRPIIHPMAEAAAVLKHGELDDKTADEVKGLSAAIENYGNFFGQNCFMGASGTLLIVSTLNGLGYKVDAFDIAAASWPICITSIIVGVFFNYAFDWRLKKRIGKI